MRACPLELFALFGGCKVAARACVCTCCVPGQWCGSVSFTTVTGYSSFSFGSRPFCLPRCREDARMQTPKAKPKSRTRTRENGDARSPDAVSLGAAGSRTVVLAEVRPSSNQERTSMPCWPQSQGVAHERCCMQELATCFSGLPKSRGPVNPVSQLSADLEFRSLVMVIFKWLPARAFFGNWKLSGNKVSGGCGSVPRPRHLQQLPGHEGRLELGRGPPAIPSR